MKKETIIKTILIFGGGFLVYLLAKNRIMGEKKPSSSKSTNSTKSMDGNISAPPSLENAEIVANAYAEALTNNEPASRLTELNQECMKEFGLRCYLNKENKLVVTDNSGKVVLEK
jgi:hypothetical protein